MKLDFLGIGAAFYPKLGSNAAYFIHNSRLFLLDCGESVFASVLKAGLFNRTDGEVTIFLTHTHSDHCGSLGSCCLYVIERLKRPLTIVHPNTQVVLTLLSIMGVKESHFRLLSEYAENGLEITFSPVRHIDMTAYSLLIGDGREAFYYSGDASELKAEVLEALRSGKIARIYQDAMIFAGKSPSSPPHMPFAALVDMVEPAIRDRVYIMHFNQDFRAEAMAQGFSCASRVPDVDS